MQKRAIDIEICWLAHGQGLKLPMQQSEFAAGADLSAALSEHSPVEIEPGKRVLVPCGFSMAVPAGFEAQVRPRSGLALKFGVTVLNAPGTIDADYRGEVKVILINHGETSFTVHRGDRIAQLVVAGVSPASYRVVPVLSETKREAAGFGSTGYGLR